MLQLADHDFAQWLEDLHTSYVLVRLLYNPRIAMSYNHVSSCCCCSDVLDNTFLIVFSDHGARFPQFRATVQGKLEERVRVCTTPACTLTVRVAHTTA